jgi:acyl-CoA synthetase (AMP-forming)/AMP-acid ligase II
MGEQAVNSAAQLLAEGASRFPDRPALAYGEATLSFADLDLAADRLGARLKRVAGAAGDELEGSRVAIVGPNVPATVIGLFAAWRLGATAVPVSARLREFDLARVLRDADPAAVIAPRAHGGYPFEGTLRKLASELPGLRGCLFLDAAGAVETELTCAPRAEPEDLSAAAILYTSGTTGDPKGALTTHATTVESARHLAELIALEPGEASALILPIPHAFGFATLLASIAAGGLAVLVDASFSLEPLSQALTRHQATVLHGSPALFAGLLQGRPEGLSGVRTGFVGGAPCPPDVIERLDATGTRLLNVYGMTEIGAAAACRLDDPADARHRTVGRPLPGYELRIIPAQRGGEEIGEIQVRGRHVTPGYFRQPEHTAEAYDGDWFRTGDLGAIDGDGRLRISGRAKELVMVAGFNVFPAEVENFLLTHPDVLQAAVVGVPHERMEETLEAFVVPRPGSELSPADVRRYARARIAGYKLPYAVHMVSELPMLASGKPDRVELARRAQEVVGAIDA